ncbi:hypothetical protein BSKO_01593 [Bryopsis sp. KO-2023]|nr:hypothetical protein BSKO_01593 [Bryopsis sp. KO-2023]
MKPQPSMSMLAAIESAPRFSTPFCHKLSPIAVRRKCSSRRRSRCIIRASVDKSRDPGPLVVVGSINADLVLQVDRLPEPGETIAASNLETFPGGKGANQAAAAAKLGCETIMIGQIGSDSNGGFMLESLGNCGVDVGLVKPVDGPTGTAVIMLQPSGENSIVIVGGANQVTWDIGEKEQQVVSTAGAILLQREIPDSINLAVAEIASNAGVPVVLDAGGLDAPIPNSILPHLSILSPNETELARLTGMDTSTEENVKKAAMHLISMGSDTVLVKLGAEGSMLVSGQGSDALVERQPAFKVPNVVDTTGAGDCFTAAYAVGILEGRSPQDAMQLAGAAASVCIQRKGAMTSLPTKAELPAGIA